MEKAKRYLVFLFGLFISSFGVSLITKANLGTSPISAIPYVLSLNFPFTLGQFTIAFSLYWMAAVPPRQDGQPPAESPSRGTSSSPSLRAGAAVSGVEEEAEGYYLCDEGGRLSVYRCDAAGTPRALLERTDIYVNLLPEADALRFKSGYYVWSRQELETLLEELGA